MNRCQIKPAFWPALFLSLLVFSLALGGRALAQEDILTIFHTNDVHGHGLAEFDESGAPAAIGYPLFKAYVESTGAKNKMLLDAGDTLHGQPLAVVKEGGHIARLLAEVKYDALAPGNHDFDYGAPRLLELSRRYELNFISANISEKESGARLFPPYIVKQYGKFKVGVFGLTTPDTPALTGPGYVAGLNFGQAESLKNTAREMTEKLRSVEKVDLVVALTHLGTTPAGPDGLTAQDLAAAVPDLDLIVDGHSHVEVVGLTVGKTLIASTGAHFRNLGRIDISRDAQGRLTLTPRLVTAAEAGSLSPDPALDALAATISAELDRDLGQVVVTLPFALEGERDKIRGYSTNLGRAIGAALKRRTGADVAIINSGSIRSGLPAGEVSRGQLLGALPFGNYALTVSLTGEQLMATLEAGLRQVGQGGFPQFYGMTVTAIEVKSGPNEKGEVKSNWTGVIEIGGRPLEPEAVYTVAINDFMYDGGDGYDFFKGLPFQKYGTVEEIFLQYLTSVDAESLRFVDNDDVLTILIDESEAAEPEPAGVENGEQSRTGQEGSGEVSPASPGQSADPAPDREEPEPGDDDPDAPADFE